MLDEVKQQVESTVIPLIGGIVEDSQKLIRQEIQLAKTEFKEDAARIVAALIASALAASTGALAVILAAFACVHALATYVQGLPLWGCYALTSSTLMVISGLFFVRAKSKASSIKGMPEKTVDSLKENVKWIQRKA